MILTKNPLTYTMSYLTKNPLICKMSEFTWGELLKCNKHFENFDVLKKHLIKKTYLACHMQLVIKLNQFVLSDNILHSTYSSISKLLLVGR